MYAEDQTLTDIDGLFSLISASLVAAGATKTILNAQTTAPYPDWRLGREEMFKINGTLARPTSFYVFLFRSNWNTNQQRLCLAIATGIKQATIATWNRDSGYNVTVVTTAPHNFVTGDVVFISGTSNAGANNQHPGSTTNPSTITKVDDTTFTYVETDQSGVLSATGGKAIAVYGLASGRRPRDTSAFIEVTDNTAMKAFLNFDEYGFFCLVMQGDQRRMLTARQTARNNVLDEEGDVGFTTESVTGDGTNKVLTLDRACPNIQPGQRVTLISPDSDAIDYVTVYARTDNTHITVPVTNGKIFPAGTIIGYDPVPAFCGGSQSSNGSLSSMPLFFTHQPNATRGNPVQQVAYPLVASRPEYGSYLRPGLEGRFQWSALNVYSNAGWDRGWIAPRLDNKHLLGPVGVILNTQTDFDRAGVGAVPADPADYYKIFTTQICSDNFVLMLGPGAP
jgi:hypothetical protein